MKKLVSILVALVMVLSSVSCFAADATHHATEKNMFIQGKVDEVIDGEVLTLTITDGTETKYISEYDVNADGTYAIKFKFNSDTEGLKYSLGYGDEVIEDGIVSISTSKLMEAEVFVTDKNSRSYDDNVDLTADVFVYAEKTLSDGTVLPQRTYTSVYAIEERAGLKAVVNLTNKFGYDEKATVMVAAYDANNKLIDCKVESVDVAYGYEGENQTLQTAEISVPENTDHVKAFCWSSETDLIPYGSEADGNLPKVDIFCIGDSFCADYEDRAWYPESGWGTHLASYFNEDYVTVTNYGTSGGWAQAIMSNTNDPVYQANVAAGLAGKTNMYGWNDWADMLKDTKFSEGDYIIVSLGLNDSGKPGPDGISYVDWYAMGIEDMVKSAKENGANLILCSAMLRANMEHPAGTQELVDRTEEIANKYGLPYLAVSDAQAKQYSEEFGYELGKVYTTEEQEVFISKIYSKYYLDRDALKDPNHEFHLSDEERANHKQSTMYDSHSSGRNSHPNMRGADNMARLIAELLKDTNSNLKFYVK